MKRWTATLTMTYYANNVGFEIFRLGRAAASSIAIFVLVVLCVLLLARAFLKVDRDRRGGRSELLAGGRPSTRGDRASSFEPAPPTGFSGQAAKTGDSCAVAG